MNIIISKIDPTLELENTDYTSLRTWEATQDYGDENFAVAVLHVSNDTQYEYLLNNLNFELEDLPFNYLLIHSGGKIFTYKYKDDFMQISYGKNFFKKEASQKNAYQDSMNKFLAEKFSIYKTSVFLCHASEDKRDIVMPITNALKDAQIEYWLDSIAIKLGDSITGKINEGLRSSEYFILILSKYFVNKRWPEKEMNSIISVNINNESDRIIPILIGTEEEKRKIIENYPILADMKYFSWQNNPDEFIDLFNERLNRDITSVKKKFPKNPNP